MMMVELALRNMTFGRLKKQHQLSQVTIIYQIVFLINIVNKNNTSLYIKLTNHLLLETVSVVIQMPFFLFLLPIICDVKKYV